MKERVFTLMWGTAWERYGHKFAATFKKHWPGNVELMIVTDKALPIDWATQVMMEEDPAQREFFNGYSRNRRACGLESTDRKAVPGKRFWKHDAVKWAPQGICSRAGLKGMEDGDLLAWFDADVETIADVPKYWINVLLNGGDLACLQRDQQHPEIGFWAVRVGKNTRDVIGQFAGIYESGLVFSLPEWHSGYVFGEALRRVPTTRVVNLNGKNLRGHVWPSTSLAQFTRHNKGKLKDQ